MKTRFKKLLEKITELEEEVRQISEAGIWAKYKAEDIENYHGILENIARELGYYIPEDNKDDEKIR